MASSYVHACVLRGVATEALLIIGDLFVRCNLQIDGGVCLDSGIRCMGTLATTNKQTGISQRVAASSDQIQATRARWEAPYSVKNTCIILAVLSINAYDS